jgi:hypothetical protein
MKATILFFLLIASAAAQSQNEITLGNISMTPPRGWTVARNGPIVNISAPTRPASNMVMLVFSANPTASPRSDVQAQWPDVLSRANARDANASPLQISEGTTKSGLSFAQAGRAVFSAAAPGYMHLLAIRADDQTLFITALADSAAVFESYRRNIFEPFADSVQVRVTRTAAPAPPPSPSANRPAPQSASGPRSPVVGMYGGFANVNTDVVTGVLHPAIGTVHLYFFEDGSVYRGYANRGYDRLDVAALRQKSAEAFGTYTFSGNTIQVRYGQFTFQYARDDKGALNCISGGCIFGPSFTHLPSGTGMTFDGTYSRAGLIQDPADGPGPPRITFTKAGQFTDVGMVKVLASVNYFEVLLTPDQGSPWTRNVRPGSGTYSTANNSLYLNYSDGRRMQMGFYVMPKDEGSARPAYLNIKDSGIDLQP